MAGLGVQSGGSLQVCGVFGYVGEPRDVGTDVLRALRSLEYRGYDSWGIALETGGRITLEKHTGRIAATTSTLPDSRIGFGHTRWATHGGVTEANAHPHLDCDRRLAVIHNGIVENFRTLRDELIERGHRFQSETDSEVIVHLLEDAMKASGSTLSTALATIFPRLHGLNAVIAFDVERRELAAAKNTSPLVVGVGAEGSVIASDTHALNGHADRVAYLEDDQLVRLDRGGIVLYHRRTMREVGPTFLPIPETNGDTGLGSFPHFMAKEMAEQPAVLERLVRDRVDQIEALSDAIKSSFGTFLVGCGTASYAASTGSYLFSRIAKRHINAIVGSEFPYHEHFITPDSLVVALSQSGETADVIEAMLSARRSRAHLAAILNAEQSTLDRMVDLRVHLNAGIEQCVLSTKAYTAKVAVLLLAAHQIVGKLSDGQDLVRHAAEGMEQMLSSSWVDHVKSVAQSISSANNLFVVGRGLSYPTALEAALKIKEVSYIHAEGFAGGELKHGVIALVTQGTPCVVYAPNDETRADMLSGAMELKSRGGYIIGIGPDHDPVFDIHLVTPDVGVAAPLVNALPAQMLGYHVALIRGNDPDRPRNLAKSVTVK